MLQERDNKELREFWQKYFIVFSIAYVSSEVLELSLYMIIPFITLAQVVGVSLLVLPKTRTTQSLYNHFILPFYETHKSFIQENLVDNYMNRTWTQGVNYVLKICKRTGDDSTEGD